LLRHLTSSLYSFSLGDLSGVLSERDIIHKVALLDCDPAEVIVKEIFTPNPVTVFHDDCIDDCMSLMLRKDFRHLPVVSRSEDKVVVGMISIKDCVKTVVDSKEETIHVLQNFALGKSGTFVVD
jgi:signal-transduction protein with cAMP-binding, CBS, and nucleotidyltransferase domain